MAGNLCDALATLEKLQQRPIPQLTNEEREQLGASLAIVRQYGKALPEAAWQVLEQAGANTTLEALYARRIMAQRQRADGAKPTLGNWLSEELASALRIRKARLGQRLLRSRFHSWYLRACQSLPAGTRPSFREYASWASRQTSVSRTADEWRVAAAGWARQPTVTILLAVHNTRRAWLRAAVESVTGQSYPKWELAICNDAAKDPWVQEYLEDAARQDGRIKVVRTETNSGVSAALNRAAEQSSGEYLGVLDHDDMLDGNALTYIVERLQEAEADVIYTDEDFVDGDGVGIRPHFKPEWSPRLLDSCMYLGHLTVVKRTLFERAGRFRSELDGAQDYDLALRVTELAQRIEHVPKVAYHWRMHRQSTAADVANKPHTHHNGLRALDEALKRRKWKNASASDGNVPNLFFVDTDKRAMARPDVVTLTGPEDAAMVGEVNRRAAAGSAGVIVFLRADLQPVSRDWLELLEAQVLFGNTGIAAPRIVDPGGAIAQAGIVLGLGDGVGRIGRGLLASPHWLWLDAAREVSAVAFDCLVVRRPVFEKLGGFDVTMAPYYHAVDFCLRAREAGYASVVEPRAVLRQIEAAPANPIAPAADWERFVTRWREALSRVDPYFSPNLRQDCEDIRLV